MERIGTLPKKRKEPNSRKPC